MRTTVLWGPLTNAKLGGGCVDSLLKLAGKTLRTQSVMSVVCYGGLSIILSPCGEGCVWKCG